MLTSKRPYKPKVRTGCNTCKLRHVKCDEAKPNCLRCTKAGRTCDYTRVPNPIPEILFGTHEERRSLHFYREIVGPEMSNYFDGPFWTASVLQLSHNVPASKHLLTAMGSVYEKLIGEPNAVLKPHPFAMTQVSKSINMLLDESSQSPLAVLICCILFAACGNLLDDLSGLRHIKSGLKIANEIEKNPDHHFWKSVTTSEAEMTRNILIPILRRFAFVTSLLDPVAAATRALKSGKISRSGAMITMPTIFNNIRNAEECHNSFVSWVIGQMEPAPETVSGFIIPIDRYSAIALESDKFIRAIDSFMAHIESKDDKRLANLIAAAALLKIAHYSTGIFFKAMNFTTETEYDDLEDDLANLISYCKFYLVKLEQKPNSIDRNLLFGTDQSLLLPLFLACSRTRNPNLRRKAIKIMGNARVAEGVMGSRTCAIVAGAIMQVEEKGLESVTKASDIPESNRVRMHDASFFNYLSGQFPMRLRFKRYPYKVANNEILTEAVWLILKRERPVFWDSREHEAFHDPRGSIPTPASIEGLIQTDLEHGNQPDIVMSQFGVSWADRAHTPLRYDFLDAESHFLQEQILRF